MNSGNALENTKHTPLLDSEEAERSRRPFVPELEHVTKIHRDSTIIIKFCFSQLNTLIVQRFTFHNEI